MRLTFPIRDMYIAAIDRAEHDIRFTNAYFVPDRMLLEALQAAARRGVDVQILVPLKSCGYRLARTWVLYWLLESWDARFWISPYASRQNLYH